MKLNLKRINSFVVSTLVTSCENRQYATCGRRYFCIRIKNFTDTKISGYVWTGLTFATSKTFFLFCFVCFLFIYFFVFWCLFTLIRKTSSFVIHSRPAIYVTNRYSRCSFKLLKLRRKPGSLHHSLTTDIDYAEKKGRGLWKWAWISLSGNKLPWFLYKCDLQRLPKVIWINCAQFECHKKNWSNNSTKRDSKGYVFWGQKILPTTDCCCERWS